MLDLIAKEAKVGDLCNVEIVPEVYRVQVNKAINLIGGDALSLPFKNYSFDVVMAKNLLHHLVGKTVSSSKKNALQAISEMFRVTKKNGYVIILEQYNQCKVCSSIIFYITLILAQLGVAIKQLGLQKFVIVNFLTPEELENMVGRFGDTVFGDKIKLGTPLLWKISLLMSNIGRCLIIAKKNAEFREDF